MMLKCICRMFPRKLRQKHSLWKPTTLHYYYLQVASQVLNLKKEAKVTDVKYRLGKTRSRKETAVKHHKFKKKLNAKLLSEGFSTTCEYLATNCYALHNVKPRTVSFHNAVQEINRDASYFLAFKQSLG